MNILSLPPELLEEVCSWLTPKDIISISSTCHIFNKASKSDQLWAEVCFKTFGVKIPSLNGFARRFYKNVIHKFEHLLGFWKIHADCYGGLMQILFHDGKLCGMELRVPKEPHLTQPLRPKTLFTISMDESNDDMAVIKCCINPLKEHECTLHYGVKAIRPNSASSLYLTRRCADGVDGSEHQQIADLAVELENWLADQVDITKPEAVFRTRGALIYKYMVFRQIDLKTHYSRLVLPSACNFPVPIQPGIFKGTYSAHGIELIMLSYDDHNKVTGLKITGDPNIPAGQVTFRADLPFCMHLTEEAQSTLERIEQIEAASSDVDWSELPTPQPFVLPVGCDGRHPDIPSECKARFHGFGQIARDGYQDASFIEGHWIVFNENFFGFLWISLESLSLYHRVQDSSLQMLGPS